MASSTVAVQSQPSASIKFPNHAEFRATSIKQHFSIPESIVNYMIKNPPSAKVYQKLVECCKYFFPKNPILVYHCLWYEKNEWKTCVDRTCLGDYKNWKLRKIDLDLVKIQSKIWVTHHLRISSSNPDLAASLIPKLYDGNVKCLTLSGQNISFNDFLPVSQKMNQLYFCDSYLFFQNGVEVPCETILANLPMIQSFAFNRTLLPYDFSKTVAELLKIPHFKKLKRFGYCGISESFDIDTFFEFLKRNKTTWAYLKFTGQLSDEYKGKLNAIVDEMLNAESPRAYIPPCFRFDGQLRIKQEALILLNRSYLK